MRLAPALLERLSFTTVVAWCRRLMRTVTAAARLSVKTKAVPRLRTDVARAENVLHVIFRPDRVSGPGATSGCFAGLFGPVPPGLVGGSSAPLKRWIASS